MLSSSNSHLPNTHAHPYGPYYAPGVLLVLGVALNGLNRNDSGASGTGSGFGHPEMGHPGTQG